MELAKADESVSIPLRQAKNDLTVDFFLVGYASFNSS